MFSDDIYLSSKKAPKDVSGKVAKSSKMSIIAVRGEALDKIGFDVAERANRSADVRLKKVISTFNVWRSRTSAK